MLAAMKIADPLGVPGAPLETWEELKARLNDEDIRGARLVMVTDRQGDRPHAGYGVLLTLRRGDAEEGVVTVAAFGPRYGESGVQALTELITWAHHNELILRETVLPSGDFTRFLAEPDEREVRALLAASNPADPGLYVPLPGRDSDDWVRQ